MKEAFDFLRTLAKNNHRQWFADHKPQYDAIAKHNKKFFQNIFETLSEYDEISKMHIFRIYKDVRFSKDKTPYKQNFGCSFSRVKPMLRGGYYVHIEPENSFVGGGFWAPSNEDLYRIRKEFEIDDEPIRNITTEEKFVQYFGTLKGEDGVKVAPKGFDKNHPAIDLIKKKQWVVMRSFSDEEVCADTFSAEVIDTFLAMRPWFDYMSEVLTTDLNGEPLY